jgi:PAS domain S-box-containing protein
VGTINRVESDNGEILIVEDNVVNLKSLSAIISAAGYRVASATDGASALREIGSKRPDLVIMDIQLPDIDGVEVCRRLKQDASTLDLPVIFISGSDEPELKVSAFEAGGADYITKPYHPVEVLARIKTHLDLAGNIAGLKRAEHALKESNDKFLSLASRVPANIAYVNADTLIYEYVNKGYEKSFGVPRDKIVGRHIKEFIGEENFQYALKYIDDVSAGKSVSYENSFNLSTGTRWLEVNFSPFFGADGAVESIVVLSYDITERKRAEKALRESEFFFKESQRAASIGSYKTDFIAGFWESSEVLDAIFGIDKTYNRSIQGWLDIVFPDDREMMDRYLREEVIAKRMPFVREYRIVRRSDGEVRWVNGLGAVTFDADGAITSMIGTIQDITNQKKSQEIMHNVQKLEALGVLAGGIAHDFNNLMGGIFGYIDLANEETRDEKVTHFLTKAMNTIDRARGLTQQLLTFAKGGAPVLKIDSLFPFVQETAQFALSGSSVSCRFEVPHNLWPCNYDTNQIGQVFDNIVINAQQAMPGGGTIHVSAKNISFGNNEHPSLAAGNYVRVSFEDSGIGIPKEILPRIFDPFYTTKTSGHGLGLATCFSIVNRHGGCIDVESEPGKGSTFHVFLPAASGVAGASSAEEPAAEHQGGGTILVMDDEEVIRDILSGMLKSFGYTVVCTENGRDAADFFSAEIKAGRKIVAMIFDLTIPGGMGGREAISGIRALDAGAKVPVFAVSGYADDPVMINPADYGFTASICKPFRKKELAEMLAKHLLPHRRNGIILSPSIP